jgi:hypothetical protein
MDQPNTAFRIPKLSDGLNHVIGIARNQVRRAKRPPDQTANDRPLGGEQNVGSPRRQDVWLKSGKGAENAVTTGIVRVENIGLNMLD